MTPHRRATTMHTGTATAVAPRAPTVTSRTSILTPRRGLRRPLHDEGLGAGVQFEPFDRVESCSSVQRDRAFVGCCDHHVGGVLPPPADLGEETLHQKRSRPPPPHDRIDGDGQQLRALAGTTGAMAKGLDDPAPRSKQPAATGERGCCAVTPYEGPIEAGHIGGTGEESHGGRVLLDDEQERPRGPGDPPVQPAQKPRAEDGQEPLADLSRVEGGGWGGVSHRSGAKHHAVPCVRIHRPRRRLRTPRR